MAHHGLDQCAARVRPNGGAQGFGEFLTVLARRPARPIPSEIVTKSWWDGATVEEVHRFGWPGAIRATRCISSAGCPVSPAFVSGTVVTLRSPAPWSTPGKSVQARAVRLQTQPGRSGGRNTLHPQHRESRSRSPRRSCQRHMVSRAGGGRRQQGKPERVGLVERRSPLGEQRADARLLPPRPPPPPSPPPLHLSRRQRRPRAAAAGAVVPGATSSGQRDQSDCAPFCFGGHVDVKPSRPGSLAMFG